MSIDEVALDVIIDAMQRAEERRVNKLTEQIIELHDDKQILNDTVHDLQQKVVDLETKIKNLENPK